MAFVDCLALLSALLVVGGTVWAGIKSMTYCMYFPRREFAVILAGFALYFLAKLLPRQLFF
jgi:hypothetical protein